MPFGGSTYVAQYDFDRLNAQLRRVADVMKDGKWRTLDEICHLTGDVSSAAISARLRDFRKEKFGGLEVERRRRGCTYRGLFEYRVVFP